MQPSRILTVSALILIYLAITPAWFDRVSTTDDAHFYLLPYTTVEDEIVNISKGVAPPGYQALMYSLSWADNWNPMFPSRLVQLLALTLYLYWAVRVGDWQWGWKGGILTGCWSLSSSWLVSLFAGGLPHAFAPGFFMWLLYGCVSQSRQHVVRATLAAAFFVPQAMAVGGLISLMFSYRASLRDLKLWSALFVSLSMALISPVTRAPSLTSIEAFPEFNEGGRANLAKLDDACAIIAGSLTKPLQENRKQFRVLLEERKNKPGWVMTVLREWHSLLEWGENRGGLLRVLFSALPLIFLPLEVYMMFVAMMFCYFIASLVPYSLYVPARFWLYGAVAISTLGWPLALINLRGVEPRALLGREGRLTALMLLAFWGLGGPGIRPNVGFNWSVWNEQSLYDFVRTTEKDAVWAGPPKDPGVIGLSLYTGRKCYVTWETAVPWRIDIYKQVAEPRLNHLIDAFWHGKSSDEIDYMILPKRGGPRWIFEPFQSRLPSMPSSVPGKKLVYQDAYYAVVRM